MYFRNGNVYRLYRTNTIISSNTLAIKPSKEKRILNIYALDLYALMLIPRDEEMVNSTRLYAISTQHKYVIHLYE